MLSKIKIKSVHMAYHVCPIGNWVWNLETLSQYVGKFTGHKVVGLATIPGMKISKVENVIYKHLGDDVVIKKYKNNPILRESMTFPHIMRYLEVKANQKSSCIWYGHTKGITHIKKFAKVTQKWAELCYLHTLGDKAFEESVKVLEEGYAMSGPFKRYGKQHNFPPQLYHWHYSGTFFFVRPDALFSRERQVIIRPHRYAIEALPGEICKSELGYCTFGDGIGDLYNEKYLKKLLGEK